MKKKPALRIGMLLPRALSLKALTVDRVLDRIGLTHSSWIVLNCISHSPGQSAHALAEMCFVTDQSFGQLALKLAKQGLIKRTPGFGKAILHELTEEGRKALTAADPLMESALQEFCAGLTDREQGELAKLLERIIMKSGNAKLMESVQAGAERIKGE